MKKILVVEDDEQNMYMVCFLLKKHGHEVIEAETGEQGVALAIKERPDLIIMDIGLPGIDGLEATKRIRESEEAGDVPVVALTSYAMIGDRERAMNAGCSDYIEKPIKPATIMAKIEKYL